MKIRCACHATADDSLVGLRTAGWAQPTKTYSAWLCPACVQLRDVPTLVGTRQQITGVKKVSART